MTTTVKNPQISFDYCIKCTICNTVCPVISIFPQFPGPKYLGPDSQRFRIQNLYDVEEVSKYCLNCKRCEAICPSDVSITSFIENDKFKSKKKTKYTFRSLFFRFMDFVGRLATTFSTITNFVLSLSIVRWLMEKFLFIHKKRALPKYNKMSFRKYYKKNYISLLDKNHPQKSSPISTTNYIKKSKLTVHYFHGCNVNYNNLELGKDLLSFCNRHHIEVKLPEQKCCGIPIASAGESDAYKKRALYHFNIFWDIIKKNEKIISVSSSCSMAIKQDYLRLLPLSEEEKIQYSNGILYFNDFLDYLKKQGFEITTPTHKILSQETEKKKYDKLVYHVPCHVKYASQTAKTVSFLRKLTNNLIVIEDNCCGIAGSYGVKKETYQVSQDIGQLLFDKLEMHRDGIFVSDCETCRMQISENTKKEVYHPLTLLERDIQ